jgi:hypothetical protein
MAMVNSHPDFWRAVIVGLTLVGLVVLGETVARHRRAATAGPLWLVAVAAVAASGLIAAVAFASAQ